MFFIFIFIFIILKIKTKTKRLVLCQEHQKNKKKKQHVVWLHSENENAQSTEPHSVLVSNEYARKTPRKRGARARARAPLRLPPALRLDSITPDARRCENGLNSAKRARGTARAPPFRRPMEKIRSARSAGVASRSARPARARPRGRRETQLGVTVTHGRVMVRWGVIRRFCCGSNLSKSATLRALSVCGTRGGGCRCGTHAAGARRRPPSLPTGRPATDRSRPARQPASGGGCCVCWLVATVPRACCLSSGYVVL